MSVIPSPSSLGPLLSQGSAFASSLGNLPNANGTIPQTERLLTTRPRYAGASTTGGDRGYRAYIQVMSSTVNNQLTGPSASTSSLPAGLQGPGSALSQALNGTGQADSYAEFLLTEVTCSLDEKMQITETFGDGEVVYYFGRQPIMFNMSGILIDSIDNNWFVDWLHMYSNVMRGSMLAQNYQLLKIVLPNMTLIGTMPSMNFRQSSENDAQIQFGFQFQVKVMTPTPVMKLGVPLTNAAQVLNLGSSSASSFLSQQGINSLSSQINNASATIKNPASTVSQIGASLTGIGGGMSGSLGAGFPGGSLGASGSAGGLGGVLSDVNSMFNTVSANLAGIRASLFSPIFGVLTSLTKLIQNVAGDVASVFNALTAVVQNVVRDVLSVSAQALGILNIMNATVNLALNAVGQIETDLSLALSAVMNTVGTITTEPMTITAALRALVNSGAISVSIGFLQNPPVAALSFSSANLPSKIALLNSGPVPSPMAGAFL
jgi:hypothetical protein